MNSGIEYESIKESIYSQKIPIGATPDGNGAENLTWSNMNLAPAQPVYFIALPIPLSKETTQLLVELNGHWVAAGTGQLQIFSQVTSTI